MLRINIPAIRAWDPEKEEFINTKETVLVLEHSLLSVSKWESKWHKYFLDGANKKRKIDPKTPEMIIDYIRCMTINQVDPEVYAVLPDNIISQITDYIADPSTATVIVERGPKKIQKDRNISSEEIYAWMVEYGIPFECEKWHLNRLMTLIRVLSVRNGGEKKMSKNDIHSQYRRINEMNRARFHSKG